MLTFSDKVLYMVRVFHSLFAVRCSRSLFAVRCSPFAVRRSPFAVRRSPFVICDVNRQLIVAKSERRMAKSELKE